MRSSIASGAIMGFKYLLAAAGAALLLLAAPAAARADQPGKKIPVLIDTDIGFDLDDPLALGLALVSPELDVRGVTTVDGDAHTRAQLVARLLFESGRKDIP